MAHGGGGESTCLPSMSSGLGLTNPCHAKCLSISDSSTTGAYIHYERTFQDIYSIFISCFCFLFFVVFQPTIIPPQNRKRSFTERQILLERRI